MELVINIGTMTGAKIAHFVEATGKKRLEITTRMKVINIRTMPVAWKLLTISVSEAVIKTPMLLFLNMEQNWAAKKIRTKIEEIFVR